MSLCALQTARYILLSRAMGKYKGKIKWFLAV